MTRSFSFPTLLPDPKVIEDAVVSLRDAMDRFGRSSAQCLLAMRHLEAVLGGAPYPYHIINPETPWAGYERR